jgi:hypothetical protein
MSSMVFLVACQWRCRGIEIVKGGRRRFQLSAHRRSTSPVSGTGTAWTGETGRSARRRRRVRCRPPVAFFKAAGTLPTTGGSTARERALGLWLHRRRMEAAAGTLSQETRHRSRAGCWASGCTCSASHGGRGPWTRQRSRLQLLAATADLCMPSGSSAMKSSASPTRTVRPHPLSRQKTIAPMHPASSPPGSQK